MSINNAKIKQGERRRYVQLSPHKFVLYSIWSKNANLQSDIKLEL